MPHSLLHDLRQQEKAGGRSGVGSPLTQCQQLRSDGFVNPEEN